MSELEFAAIIGMAFVTYLTRIGGLLVTSDRASFNPFAERFLKNLPAALLAALISPKLASGDVSIWLAALVTVAVVWRVQNTLLGVAAGTLSCAAIRWFIG